MKNAGKKLLAILLAAILTLSVVACGGKKPADSNAGNGGVNTPPGNKTYLYDLADYEVIYSNKLSNRAGDAVTALAARISDGTDVEKIPAIDRITAPVEKEILIGATDRPESEEALALVTNDDSFVIKTIGNKLVINAKNDMVLISGLEYLKTLVTKQGFGFDEIEYVSEPVSTLKVIENGKSQFSIVHLDGLDTDLTDENAKYDLEVKLGHDLQTSIKTKAKVTLPVESDAKGKEYEIHVGVTSNPLCLEFRNSLAYDEYGYKVYGNKIIVLGTNSTTMKKAVELFTETVNAFTADGSLTLYDGMCITRRAGTWNMDIPEFEGGQFGGTLDSGLKSITVLYENTTAEAFEAYCKKLEAEGYVLWQRHDIEDNLHATYTHEIRGMIHTYFTANESNVRIVAYRKGTYTLPTNPEKVNYESVTKSAITLFGVYEKSVGLGMVITLEDGSFIVVDSGDQDDKATLHHDLFNLLKHLNKRPDGKIVIKAWYLTHEHGDHYGVFAPFLKEYGKQITLEEFWCNPSTSLYTYNGANGTITWEKNYSKYRTYVNGDFEWINFHTGMEFYAANMKFEILYTEEDLFPRVCRSYNNSCTIVKMTDTRNGQTMLIMGDLLYDGCEVLAKKYDGYLKSDILQASHHGKSEALSVYKQVVPSVVLWPCASYSTTNRYGPSNLFLRNTAKTHINAQSTYTIYLPFKEGDTVYRWNKGTN